MTEDDSKSGLTFWIRSLAVSILFVAVTFFLLASYLAEIKENTSAALARTEIIAQHLDTLDSEILLIHNRIIEQKAALAASAVPAVAAPVPATDAAPPSASSAIPATESGASVTVPVPSVAVPAAAVPAAAAPAVVAPSAGTALPAIQAPVLSAPPVTPSKP